MVCREARFKAALSIDILTQQHILVCLMYAWHYDTDTSYCSYWLGSMPYSSLWYRQMTSIYADPQPLSFGRAMSTMKNCLSQTTIQPYCSVEFWGQNNAHKDQSLFLGGGAWRPALVRCLRTLPQPRSLSSDITRDQVDEQTHTHNALTMAWFVNHVRKLDRKHDSKRTRLFEDGDIRI